VTDPARQNRFSDPESSGAAAGLDSSVGKALFSRGDIVRNIKPYAKYGLKAYASSKGLRKLRGKDYQQFENMAARAVLKKYKVKKRKLDVNMDRSRFNKPLLQRASRKIAQGYDKRVLGQQGKDVKNIHNAKLRKATRHVIAIRRNRRIMSTNIMSGKGYDIQKGHIAGPRPLKKYRLGLG
jgi:hypothetical protein